MKMNYCQNELLLWQYQSSVQDYKFSTTCTCMALQHYGRVWEVVAFTDLVTEFVCKNTWLSQLVYWAVQARLLTPLTFAWHSFKSPLAAFTSGAYFLFNSVNGRWWQWICKFYTASFKSIIGGPESKCVWQQAITVTCCSYYSIGWPKKHFFPTKSRSSTSSGQPKNNAKTLFSHPPSPFAFVQLCHAYSEISLEVTLRLLATSCAKDYKGHSLMQTSFTELPKRGMMTKQITPKNTPMCASMALVSLISVTWWPLYIWNIPQCTQVWAGKGNSNTSNRLHLPRI